MLSTLSIRDFAIVDSLSVEFSAGLTVLTGETGAGKSILIDALGFLLGDRADKTVVADGAKRAELTASFDLSECPAAADWLADQALDADECIVRRVISADGGSRAFVNSTPVTVQALGELGSLLIEIHGQHAHQRLASQDRQRNIVDAFAGNEALSVEAADAYDAWQTFSARHEEALAANRDRDSRMEFLRFQLDELARVAAHFGDTERLAAERDRAANASRLMEAASAALALVYDDDNSAQSTIAQARSALSRAHELDSSLEPAIALLDEAEASIGEAADELRRYVETLDSDPARRDELENLLGELTGLARKHRVELGELADHYAALNDELAALSDAEATLAGLDAEIADAKRRYDEAAGALNRSRESAAAALGADVTRAMHELGMTGGTFRIAVEPDADRPRRHGIDRIAFEVSANPGQSLKPIGKVASGGELSRISLALHVIAAGNNGTPTLIFDEIDVGVGGGVAEIVGATLAELGAQRQVLCVTHLPQVASQGDHHLRVLKISDARSSRTSLAALDGKQRIDEIARMLGGVEITERTRAHAEEMLSRKARSRKKTA